MHRLKYIIFPAALAALSLLLFACAGTGEPSPDAQTYNQVQEEKQALLEKTFGDMQAAIARHVPPETLWTFITDSSRYWMDTLENVAKYSPAADVEQRQFCEILAVITYRLYDRERLWKVPDNRMLNLLTGEAGFIQRAASLKLGPFMVRNDRGSVGLASSPNVPVLLFTWDDAHWKLDMVASFPLVTKGLETIGVKKNWSNSKLALYLLDKQYHYQYLNLDETLLDPVPAR